MVVIEKKNGKLKIKRDKKEKNKHKKIKLTKASKEDKIFIKLKELEERIKQLEKQLK